MKKLTIKKMQEVARERNGQCLSNEYINCSSKLKWKCNKDNNIWFARPHQVLSCNSWCPECKRLNATKIKSFYNFDKILKICKNKHGKCLSKKYKGISKILKFQCKNNHIWYAMPQTILRGHWCAKCFGNKRLTIEKIQQIAKNNNGDCLSKEYKNSKSKLIFKCNKDKNVWLSNARQLVKGRWCPECASGRSEKICREYLEKKVGFKFVKCKPEWLQGLELDGYCKELNLAFEYNGEQHYRHIIFFHKTKQQFAQQKERDVLKEKLCKQNNTILIKIPYKYNCYDINELSKFIDTKLK